MKTHETFRKACAVAGLTGSFQDIAHRLGISPSYAKRLWNGADHVSKPLRDKFDAMIAAKGNGPEFATDIIDQAVDLKPEPAEPTPVLAPVIERAETAKSELRYQLWAGVDKMRIIEVIAVVNDPDQARRLCDLLNKEAG